MAKGHKITDEEVVAKKIVQLLADIRLDLDMLGLYFGKFARLAVYKRLGYIYEVAKHHREGGSSREAHYEEMRNFRG